MNLHERFYNLLRYWFDDETVIEQRWQELTKSYGQSFRSYHNFNHLKALFNYFDAYKSELKHPYEVAYAIFYHDIIYNIWSKKNELNSAELATKHLLNTALDDRSKARIFNLIMVTKNHTPSKNRDENWIVDFDIAILGQPWEVYLQYTQQIRAEYASIPNVVYKRGRRRVLNHFLNTHRIYKTDTFFGQFEMDARNNLKKELDIL